MAAHASGAYNQCVPFQSAFVPFGDIGGARSRWLPLATGIAVLVLVFGMAAYVAFDPGPRFDSRRHTGGAGADRSADPMATAASSSAAVGRSDTASRDFSRPTDGRSGVSRGRDWSAILDELGRFGIRPSPEAWARAAEGAGELPLPEIGEDRELVFDPTPALRQAMETVDQFSRGEILRTVDAFRTERADWIRAAGLERPFETMRNALAEGYTVESAFRRVLEVHGSAGRRAADAVFLDREAD